MGCKICRLLVVAHFLLMKKLGGSTLRARISADFEKLFHVILPSTISDMWGRCLVVLEHWGGLKGRRARQDVKFAYDLLHNPNRFRQVAVHVCLIPLLNKGASMLRESRPAISPPCWSFSRSTSMRKLTHTFAFPANTRAFPGIGFLLLKAEILIRSHPPRHWKTCPEAVHAARDD